MNYEMPKEKLLPEHFPKNEKTEYKTDTEEDEDFSFFTFFGIFVFSLLIIYLIIEFTSKILDYFR